jgi:hypothetical protein
VSDEGAILELIDQFQLDFGGKRQRGDWGDVLTVHPLGNATVTGSGNCRSGGGLRKARWYGAGNKEEESEAEWNTHRESSQVS